MPLTIEDYAQRAREELRSRTRALNEKRADVQQGHRSKYVSKTKLRELAFAARGEMFGYVHIGLINYLDDELTEVKRAIREALEAAK